MTDLRETACLPSVTDLLEAVEFRGRTWCYVDLAEDGGFSVRSSDAALLHVVVAGEVVLARTGGEPLRLVAGDGVVVTSGEAHAVRAAAAAEVRTLDFLSAEQAVDIPATIGIGRGRYGARLLSARLRMTWPEGLSRSVLPAVLSLESHGATELQPVMLQRHSSGPGATVILTRLASAMLADALRRELLERGTRQIDAGDPLDQARRLVELGPGKLWTVETLARAVGMGRSNFSAQFSRAYDQSPMEFVTQVRMERAADLLRQDNTPVQEISEQVGYACESAFARRFAKHFGMSPGALRLTKAPQRTPSAHGGFGVLLHGLTQRGQNSA